VKVSRHNSERRSEAKKRSAPGRCSSLCRFARRWGKPQFCVGESASERHLISLMCEGLMLYSTTKQKPSVAQNAGPFSASDSPLKPWCPRPVPIAFSTGKVMWIAMKSPPHPPYIHTFIHPGVHSPAQQKATEEPHGDTTSAAPDT
jgi:hypothetical protein